MKNTCGKCPAEWVGLNICHCSGCHRTFTVLRWFDAHRISTRSGGACADPAGLKHESGSRIGQPLMRLNERGFWQGADPRPEHLNKREEVA